MSLWRPVPQRCELLIRSHNVLAHRQSWHNLIQRRYRSNSPEQRRHRQKIYDRVTGVWLMSNPENTSVQSVVEQLPRLSPWTQSRLTSALFFVTPRLAKWFEHGHPFHQDAINHMYQTVSISNPPTSLVTVVDALPDGHLYWNDGISPTTVLPGHEGIAVCLARSIPYTMSAASGNGDDAQGQSLINFKTHVVDQEQDVKVPVTVTLPAANTLFVNGRRTTMYRQMWESSMDEDTVKWVPQTSQTALSSLDILIPHHRPDILSIRNVPLSPITPGRKIVSSMGNVLRELQGDGDTILKASTELEAMVPQFIKRMNDGGEAGTAQVYAMIVPPGIEHESSTLDEPARAERAIYAALLNKGRLVRVTGGGGGWGKKQGLLSLDTSVNFDPSPDLESGMFPALQVDPSVESSTHIAELLPVGSTVQFYATWMRTAKASPIPGQIRGQYYKKGWTDRQWNPVRGQVCILGTAETDESDMSTLDRVGGPINYVAVFPNFFGMLSHSGSCFSTELPADSVASNDSFFAGDSLTHQFRMDVPNSTFRLKWPTPVPQDASQLTNTSLRKIYTTSTSVRYHGGPHNDTAVSSTASLARTGHQRALRFGHDYNPRAPYFRKVIVRSERNG